MVDERLLQRMQRRRAAEPLDGLDRGTLVHDGERQAGINSLPIEQHGAGSALPMIAALLGARQAEMLAQRVEQGGPGRDLKRPFGVIYMEGDHSLCGE